MEQSEGWKRKGEGEGAKRRRWREMERQKENREKMRGFIDRQTDRQERGDRIRRKAKGKGEQGD